MNAYYLTAARTIQARRVPVPVPAAGQALVRVARVGICGSDIEYYRHFLCGAFTAKAPFVLGHEFAGEVVAVGEGVHGVQVGMPVGVDPAQPCRRCDYCHAGRYNLCRNMVFYGSASTDPHTDGAMREYIAVPAANCIPLPPGMDYDAAACLEPLSIALHACRRPTNIVGARVLVYGAGTIGMLILLTARAYGARSVTVVDPVEARRNRALELGADAAFDPADTDAILASGEYQIVFEASGAPPAVVAAVTTAARGGTVVLVGTIPRLVELPANLIMVRELAVLGSFRSAHLFGAGIDLIRDGRIDVRAVLTHSLPIAQVNEAFAATADPSALKVQLVL